ncbi:Toxin [Candidatus Magnetomoraceae bacterium gMMP-15]
MIQMEWHISFYNRKVENETLTFPKGILANFLHIVEMMEELGPALGEPYTKPFGKGLFEIRAKGKEGIGRSFFCTIKGKEIVILHSFVKKSRRTPHKEMKIARRRLKEIKS